MHPTRQSDYSFYRVFRVCRAFRVYGVFRVLADLTTFTATEHGRTACKQGPLSSQPDESRTGLGGPNLNPKLLPTQLSPES